MGERKLSSDLNCLIHYLKVGNINLNVPKCFFRHARKHFSQAEGSQLDEVRQVMGMLAFPPDTHISPYKVMFMPLFFCVPDGPWSQEAGGGEESAGQLLSAHLLSFLQTS